MGNPASTITQDSVHCSANPIGYGKGAPQPSENVKDNLRTLTVFADRGNAAIRLNKGAFGLIGRSEHYRFQFSTAGKDQILTITATSVDEPNTLNPYIDGYGISMWSSKTVKQIIKLAAGSTERMKFKVEGTGQEGCIRVNLTRGHLPMSPYKPYKRKVEVATEETKTAAVKAKKILKGKALVKAPAVTVDKAPLVSITTPLGLRTFEDPKKAIDWLNDFNKVVKH